MLEGEDSLCYLQDYEAMGEEGWCGIVQGFGGERQEEVVLVCCEHLDGNVICPEFLFH